MKIVSMQDILRLAEEKTVQTMCDGCVFAEYEELDGGRLSQTGCQAQRFDKLAKNGAKILKVEDETEERDFVVIQDRVCNMLRGEEWEINARKKGERTNWSMYALARKEILVNCTILIYLGPNQSVKDAYMTAQEIQKQEVPATNTVIVNNAGIAPADFLREWKGLQITSSEILEIPWHMEYIVEFQYQDFLDILADAPEDKKEELRERMRMRCIDLGVQKSKTIYYAFFNAGDSIPSNYLSDIDKALNDDLVRFLALDPKNKSHSGLLMQIAVHKRIGGNKERPCIDKVITQTENQECPNLVLPLTKIVKNFDLQ